MSDVRDKLIEIRDCLDAAQDEVHAMLQDEESKTWQSRATYDRLKNDVSDASLNIRDLEIFIDEFFQTKGKEWN